MRFDQFEHAPPARRRSLTIAIPAIIVGLLALVWSGLWYFAAGQTAEVIAGWRAREAHAGRIHVCGREDIGGFPFRIEVRCADARVDIRDAVTPLTVTLRNVVVAAQVYDPTHLIGEFTGPLSVAERDQQPGFTLDWAQAQA
ncbi:MAG: DUF2125 domain-containing protein, partial [Proteobacteria bacterium]|nr:DUF2125 domain-containing protein [Pseudomonadota bacterium]